MVDATKSRAGRLGGLARVRLHGNPGTPNGRRLGGSRSLKTHGMRGTGFKLLRTIIFPRYSVELAELLGIIAGDGHVDKYQTTVSTNSVTDIEHARFVKNLFEKLFCINASLYVGKERKVCVVTVHSRNICLFLTRIGMIQGSKVREQLKPPKWVMSNRSYKISFTRGLFDTDGCVFIDKHTIRGRTYRNPGIAFTNRSLPLLGHFKSILESIGLHPTQKTKYVVFLRREKDIRRYFEVIGSSNPKHLRKVTGYFSARPGGVPKWS